MVVIIICLAILLCSAWYVPFRLQQLLGWRKVWPWRAALLLMPLGFWLILVSGAYTSTSPLMAAIYNISGLFFIFYVYLFLYLFVTFILHRWLQKISGKKIALAGLALSLGLVVFGFIQAQTFTVTTWEIPLNGLTKPVSIIHIPDLHLGAQRGESYLKQLTETVNQHNPDLVLYNGDMVDSNIALTPELFSLFSAVKAEQYFTTGNHEYYLDTAKALDLIAKAGIKILRNEAVKTHGLQLVGLEYMNADRQTHDSHMVNDLTIEEELPKISLDHDLPTVLVHHSPVGLQYIVRARIDFMLAGHTHGGQVFPGMILAKLRFPYYKGRYKIDGTRLLVSQGAGTFGPWMRLGTFSEIQLIRLLPGPQQP